MANAVKNPRVPIVAVRLVKERSVPYGSGPVINAAGVHETLKPLLADLDRESLWAVFLNAPRQIIGLHQVSVGTLNGSPVSPREVFKAAILANADKIIVAHNHPSGSLTPSPEDVAVTRRLVEAGRIVGVDVIDHLIITQEGYISLRDRGLL